MILLQFKDMLTITIKLLAFWREEICSYLRYSYNPLRSEDLYHLVIFARKSSNISNVKDFLPGKSKAENDLILIMTPEKQAKLQN